MVFKLGHLTPQQKSPGYFLLSILASLVAAWIACLTIWSFAMFLLLSSLKGWWRIHAAETAVDQKNDSKSPAFWHKANYWQSHRIEEPADPSTLGTKQTLSGGEARQSMRCHGPRHIRWDYKMPFLWRARPSWHSYPIRDLFLVVHSPADHDSMFRLPPLRIALNLTQPWKCCSNTMKISRDEEYNNHFGFGQSAFGHLVPPKDSSLALKNRPKQNRPSSWNAEIMWYIC